MIFSMVDFLISGVASLGYITREVVIEK